MVISAFDPSNGKGKSLFQINLDRDMDLFVDILLCSISPDGQYIAVARSPEGPIEIRSSEGRLIQVIQTPTVGTMRWMQWSSDGKALIVSRQMETGTELINLDLQGRFTSFRKCTASSCFAIQSPDGKHLAIYDGNLSSNLWMMENF
jgi:Tol biopolymer transport system component